MKKHVHAGKSSVGVLNPDEILREIGLKQGDRMLDAGCGEGHFSLAASAIVGNAGRVYAVDSHGEVIQILRAKVKDRRSRNIEVIQADITQAVPVERDSLDICLMVNVFHGLAANKEVDRTFKLISGLLRDDGRLVLVEFNKVEGIPGPPLDVKVSPDEGAKILKPFRFEKKTVFPAGPYHYVMIFQRMPSA